VEAVSRRIGPDFTRFVVFALVVITCSVPADAVYGVEPTTTAKKIREWFLMVILFTTILLIFMLWQLPTLWLALMSAAKRNILGVIEKLSGNLREVSNKDVLAQVIMPYLVDIRHMWCLTFPGWCQKRKLNEEQGG
jgi:hypothetical protein